MVLPMLWVAVTRTVFVSPTVDAGLAFGLVSLLSVASVVTVCVSEGAEWY